MFVRASSIRQCVSSLACTPFGPARQLAQRSRNWGRRQFLVEGLEGRCLLSAISGFSEYTVPTPSANPTGIAVGSDGNLWFIENSANKIGTINPSTHAVSEFSVPTAGSNTWGITAGPDGNIWFTERTAKKIGTISPTTHAFSEFAVSGTPVGITAGPDGNIWFTEWGSGGEIGIINNATHSLSEYPKPSGFANNTMWITGGSDGNLWVTEVGTTRIARFNPTNHTYTVFGSPVAGHVIYHVASGPDGNVWFSDYDGGVGLVNVTTGAITEYSLPAPSSNSYGITAGPDGNVWFTDQAAGQIGKVGPTTGAVTEYPIDGGLSQIAGGPDGNLWFTDPGNNAVGVATLATSQFGVNQQPPATVAAGIPFGLTVEAEDSSGNLITSFNGTVTVALGTNPGGSTLGGTLSAQAAAGVATFSGLTLNKAAFGYTLYTSGGGLGWGVTNPINVTAASASQLVITQQPPATVKMASAFSLQASIEDPYGNVVTTASSSVSVAFANNPTGATLGGTLAVTASQGVATFSNLTINKTGSGYTLRVSSSGLSSAVTSPINVTKTGKNPVPLSAPAAAATPDQRIAPLVLDSPDLWDLFRGRKRIRAI